MHHEYTVLMSMVLDDEASPAEVDILREHLRVCRPCAEKWQRWRVLDHRLSASPARAAPPDFIDKVVARLGEAALLRRRVWWLIVGSVSGLVSLAVGVAIWGTLAGAWLQYPSTQLISAGSVVAQWIGALPVFLRALWVAVVGLGAPTLAGSIGVLACATCVLGATWLWLLGRRQTLFRTAGALER